MGERQHRMLIWCCMVPRSDQALMECAPCWTAYPAAPSCWLPSCPAAAVASPLILDPPRQRRPHPTHRGHCWRCWPSGAARQPAPPRRPSVPARCRVAVAMATAAPARMGACCCHGRCCLQVEGRERYQETSNICLGWCLVIEAHMTRIVRCTAACSTSLRLGVMQAGCRKLSVRRAVTDRSAPALPLRCGCRGCSRRWLASEEALSLGMKPPGETKDDSGASSANGVPLHWPDRPKLKPPAFGGMTAVCPSEGAMRVLSARSVSSWATVRVLGPFAAGRRTTTYQHLSSQVDLTPESHKQLLASNSSDLGKRLPVGVGNLGTCAT